MEKKYFKFSKGFTFLETMIAIFVISVGLIGGLGAFFVILKSSYFSYNQLIAAYLAQEGIELVRNVRDTNWLENRYGPTNDWNEGLDTCQNGCEIDYQTVRQTDPSFDSFSWRKLKIAPDGFYQYISGTDTLFSRKITVKTEGDNILIVKVEIFWNEKGKNRSLSLQEKLYKYNF